jgi:tetratricopeptide (TPR) repeat protein
MKLKSILKNKFLPLILLLLILLFLLTELLFRPLVVRQSLAQQLYKLKRYENTEKLLARNARKDKGIANANLAKSLYRQQRYTEADSTSALATANHPKASIYYDRGNAEFQNRKFEAALKSYRKALLADPEDKDTKANYELTLRKLQMQPPPPPKPQQEDKQKQEEIKNILGGLDNKESSDRQQNKKPGNPGQGKWW